MAAGKYNQRVTIQAATEADGTDGQPIETWADVATRWASVNPVGGDERMRGRQLVAEVTHLVRLRADAMTRAITPQHRLTDPLTGELFHVARAYALDRKEVELQVVQKV